ncbi:hypothetical protein K435DRAFT_810108 [Dendrothele bispora CBS 962.96]|uniref:Uncharacterized protein n=1 Tax=Dendrothele bispora (strain CBS 962.96) TaxID=1314807 RepID=A0A4S8KWG0_DENBC|nr:hypothetical protein K435DRAFT_810108 [Dendrothele bispora CBS 962.96]
MVTLKTPKVAYDHRNLRAIIQLTGGKNKKNPVHKKALRAQVKENAAFRGEKLCPGWQKWSDRGLEKLQEQGIIAPSASSPGSVYLTPKGKKLVADEKRDLGISWDPSPREFDEITGKLLRGRKRSRSPSDSQSSPSKRPRRSTRETKAQLLDSLDDRNAQIESLRARIAGLEKTERHVHPYLRGTSPLTDVEDEDEDEDVDEDEYEDEQTLRNERSQQETAPTLDAPPSVPLAAPVPTAPTVFGMPKRLMPTKSGSFIHMLSKRPTPAPSSPGSDFGDANEPFDFEMADSHDDVLDSSIRALSRANTPRFEGGLATPETTPSRPGSTGQGIGVLGTSSSAHDQREAELRDEIKKHQTLLSEAKAREEENVEKITTLERRIKEFDLLQTQLNCANANLFERDRWITGLQKNIDDLRVERDRLVTSEASLPRLQGELQNKVDTLRRQLAESEAKLVRVEMALKESNTTATALREQGQQKEGELEGLREELGRVQGLVTSRTQARDQAMDELELVQEELGILKDLLANTESERVDLLVQLEACQEEVKSKDTELEVLRGRVLGLESQVEAKTIELSQLEVRFRASFEEAEGLRMELENVKSDHTKWVTEYRETIATLEQQLADSRNKTQNLRTKLDSSELHNATLRAERDAESAKHQEDFLRLSNQLDQERLDHGQAKKRAEELVRDLGIAEDAYDEMYEKNEVNEKNVRRLNAELEHQMKRFKALSEETKVVEGGTRMVRKTQRSSI